MKLKSTLKDADACIAESGNKLGKKVKKYAEGGKVGALSGLSRLAKKFESALEMEDHAQANRIAREMDSLQPGSSKSLKTKRDADLSAVSKDKVATFAKGGKVKAVSEVAKKVKLESLVKEMHSLQGELDTAGTPGHKNEGMTVAQEKALIKQQEQVRKKIEALGENPDDHVITDESSG